MIRRALNYQCHPFVFALFRMSLGSTLLIYFAFLSNRWIEFYGPYGNSPIKLRTEFTLIRPSLFSYLHSEQGLWVFYWVLIVMILFFILGRFKKLPAIFIWLAMLSVQNSNANNVNAEEFILCVFAFYAVVMPVNATLIFNFRTFSFEHRNACVPAWSLVPFFIHIELIYSISLVLKPILDPAWVDGTLIYYAVNNFDMSRFPGLSVFKAAHAVVSRVLTWGSLIVEGAFPICVWFERFRIPLVLAMFGFQLSIAILLSGVQFFSLSMCNALILFLPSETVYHKFFGKRRLEQGNDFAGLMARL